MNAKIEEVEEVPEEELSPEERKAVLKKLEKIALEIFEDIKRGDYIITNDFTIEELHEILRKDMEEED